MTMYPDADSDYITTEMIEASIGTTYIVTVTETRPTARTAILRLLDRAQAVQVSDTTWTATPATQDEVLALADIDYRRAGSATVEAAPAADEAPVAEVIEAAPVTETAEIVEVTDGPAITAKSWTSRTGEVRRYINDWAVQLFDLDITRRKNGNISSAYLGGHSIATAEAHRLLGTIVWLDAADGVHIDHYESRELTEDEVRTAVADALAAGRVHTI